VKRWLTRKEVLLVTDIVGSTEKAIELGDLEWRELLETHNAIIRAHVASNKGHEVRSTGDGFVIRFFDRDQAEKAARLIEEDVRRLGIHVRTNVDSP
jgi:class 3 adenylate cyclase